MKKIILLLIALCTLMTFHGRTQGLFVDWAKQIGGNGGDAAVAVNVDNHRNVYTTGNFMDTVDFDPGVGVFNLMCKGACDIFIQKLDSNGNFLWAKQIGGKGTDWAESIITDTKGYIYTIGNFMDTVDFDPGSNTFNLVSKGGMDMFIQKLDSNGNFIWVKQMGGIGDDYVYSIKSDANGNIYTTGNFDTIVDFDPGIGVFNLTSNGLYDIFVQKLDSNGNFLWAKQIGGTGYDKCFSITKDSHENIYCTGAFQNAVDFDPGIGVFNLTSNGLDDFYILKLDSNGNFLWAKQIGGTGYDYDYSITIDANGNIYSTGFFQNTVDFDPGASVFNLTSNGAYDIFIQKLDLNGNFLWAKQMGGTDSDNGHSITTDANGNVYTTGSFQNTADFDPNSIIFNLMSNGAYDIFIQKLDSNGNFLWAKQMGSNSYDNGISIVCDSHGVLYSIGDFENTMYFDTAFSYTSNGSSDGFIQKLNQCASTLIPSTQTITACHFYILHNQTFTTSGIYSQIIGCDSIITMNLTIFATNDSVINNGISLTAYNIGAKYQWIDCNGNVPIIGDTNQIFTPIINGNYALIVTQNGCSDTSLCYTFSSVGVTNMTIENNIVIYPNPFSLLSTLETNKNLKGATLTVYNSFGQQVKQIKNISGQTFTLHRDNLQSGLYFLQMTQENKIIATEKLVITD